MSTPPIPATQEALPAHIQIRVELADACENAIAFAIPGSRGRGARVFNVRPAGPGLSYTAEIRLPDRADAESLQLHLRDLAGALGLPEAAVRVTADGIRARDVLLTVADRRAAARLLAEEHR